MSATGTPRPPLWWRLLPRRGLSRLVGWLARRRAPRFLLDPVLAWYCARYGVQRHEMAEPLSAYPTFLDFFTRRLRAGVRPQDPDPEAATSCADGRVQRVGRVEDGALLQVKGLTYTAAALLGAEADARPFDGGSYHVAYLAPGDYHRFHWPWAGAVERVRHLPGTLWPVNETAVARVPKLFVQNERVAVLGRTEAGHPFAFVAVGALDVGSVRLAFHDVRTNRRGRTTPETWALPNTPVRRGAECGRFELGSTIVLLLAPRAGTFDPLEPATRLQVGRRIGTVNPAG